jgi:hypothetical protein
MDRRVRVQLFGIELTVFAVVLAMASGQGLAFIVAAFGLLTSMYGLAEP